MAEFCLECLNKMNNTNYTEEDFILSDDLDFCERCKKQKKVVVARQNSYKTSSCVYSFTIFDLWDILLDTILKIIKIIYKIYKIIKRKSEISHCVRCEIIYCRTQNRKKLIATASRLRVRLQTNRRAERDFL